MSIKAIVTRSLRTSASILSRCLHTTATRVSKDPNGFLFNEKPRRPGERRKKEAWENIWVYGLGISLTIGAVGYHYKPETSIRPWAENKALERIKERDEAKDRL